MLSPEAIAKIDYELTKYPADQRQAAVMSALRIVQAEVVELPDVGSALSGATFSPKPPAPLMESPQPAPSVATPPIAIALPPPAEDEFYYADLIGLPAVSTTGEDLGTCIAVENFGAGDVTDVPANTRFNSGS